ncbi:PREDICTED: aspartic proteinase CDR1-like [Erythranthe guttata]|uniref:aspartic proteinase CDR1-like n=1 Tax=Erythranthe guttata TaxID=4155 RepID=UPI00064DFCC4|nr:PREDICTED: aspartic proteinase CDR1-like [Erythranthe guttata]|eukprot:XP_012831423.1 PREDICTED: aspartic proteinase CDR1-like [Erythranthe guttata]
MGHFISLVILLSIFSSLLASTAHSLTEQNSESNGFTADLIHRDSVISPFYSSESSYRDRIAKALQRSKARADYFANLSSFALGSSPSADMIATNGNYLMKISLGLPPVELHLSFDTGSVLMWTQCAPCKNCFPQNMPLFTPKLSSTYKTVAANSKTCMSVLGAYSRARDNTCRYSVEYLDNSYTRGILSSDTLTLNSTLGSPMSLRNFIFGCGYNNRGIFERQTCGIIGLGIAQGSFITQMGPAVGGKFSYCLISHDLELNTSKSSKIHFGKRAAVSGPGTVSTPLYFYKHVYFASLKGISVGKRKLGSFDGKIVVDSGATLTYLHKKLYYSLEAAIKKVIKLKVAEPVDELQKVCYEFPSNGRVKGIPVITFHFGGADVKLSPLNTFVRVDDNVHCLGIVPSNDVAIFGNLVQVNFLVGYDIRKMAISFKPTDCSKQ